MSLFFFQKVAENRIREAMERGEFDNLEGKGRPLSFEEDASVPPDLRMAYKILKNSGFLPPELEAKRDIRTALELLEGIDDEQERYRQVQKLNVIVTKVNMLRPRPVNLETNQVYYAKVIERITVKKKKGQPNR
jgi:hypothetical protein